MCIHRDAVMLIHIFCNFNSWQVKYMLYLNTWMFSDKYLMGVCLYPIEVEHMGSNKNSYHRCYRLLCYNYVSFLIMHHRRNYMLINWNSGCLVRQPFHYIFIFIYIKLNHWSKWLWGLYTNNVLRKELAIITCI